VLFGGEPVFPAVVNASVLIHVLGDGAEPVVGESGLRVDVLKCSEDSDDFIAAIETRSDDRCALCSEPSLTVLWARSSHSFALRRVDGRRDSVDSRVL
jgi:hypothetical protein